MFGLMLALVKVWVVSQSAVVEHYDLQGCLENEDA